MKHENLKGKDHRSDGTKERDRKAAREDSEANRKKLPEFNVGASGEPLDGGRSSARTANETRRTER